jgi:hypothetical protein
VEPEPVLKDPAGPVVALEQGRGSRPQSRVRDRSWERTGLGRIGLRLVADDGQLIAEGVPGEGGGRIERDGSSETLDGRRRSSKSRVGRTKLEVQSPAEEIGRQRRFKRPSRSLGVAGPAKSGAQ